MATPIRGIRDEQIAQNRWNGAEQKFRQEDVTHVVGDAGEIISTTTGRQTACLCGCLRPPGGFCLCGGLVCVDCLRRCRCGKPLGPCCAVLVEQPSGHTLCLCKPCSESTARKRRLRQVGRLLLSPFIKFEKQNHGEK